MLICTASPCVSMGGIRVHVCVYVSVGNTGSASLLRLGAAAASPLSNYHIQTPHNRTLSFVFQNVPKAFPWLLPLGICIWPIATVLWREGKFTFLDDFHTKTLGLKFSWDSPRKGLDRMSHSSERHLLLSP